MIRDSASEGLAFLSEAIRDLRSIGAVAPSGRALATALAEPLRSHVGRPIRVLEVGAGTGAVTRLLLGGLPRGSRLDIVEANPRFTERLRRIVPDGRLLAARAVTLEIHTTMVQQFNADRKYDAIVSGLPLRNFDPGDVEDIMSRLMTMLHPGGTLSYFAYLGTRAARTLAGSRTERLRHSTVDDVLTAYQHFYATGAQKVWANLPPAQVWHLRRSAHSHLSAVNTEFAR